MVAKQKGIIPRSAAPNRALIALRIAAQIVPQVARRVGHRAVSSAPRPAANFDPAHILKVGRHATMRATLQPAPPVALPPALAPRQARSANTAADPHGETSPCADHVRLGLTAMRQQTAVARAAIDSAAMIVALPASFARGRASSADRSVSAKSAPIPPRVA